MSAYEQMMSRNAAFFEEHEERVWQAHDASVARGFAEPIMMLFDLGDSAARRVAARFGLNQRVQQRAVDVASRECWSPMIVLTASVAQAHNILAEEAPKAAEALCPPSSDDTMAIVTVGSGGASTGMVIRQGVGAR